MLNVLEIENFAIIDHLRIEFQRGLNVLTGETGAGKSIVIDAVNLLLGGRASNDQIRYGAIKAVITGSFLQEDPDVKNLLENMGITPEEDNTLLLQRELSQNGRNFCRINGRQVTLSMYKMVGSKLIDIYGQHEHHSLIMTDQHLEIVDLLAGKSAFDNKIKLQDILHQFNKCKAKIDNLQKNRQENLQKQDLWNFQLKEIKAVNLIPGEEDEIYKEKKILNSMEKVVAGVQGAYEVLNGTNNANARDLLVEAGNQLNQLKDLDDRLASFHKLIEDCFYQVEDVAEQLRMYSENLIFDADRLTEMDNRLAQINMLKRKYGTTVAEILTYAETIAGKVTEAEQSDDIILELENIAEKYEAAFYHLAAHLTSIRQKTARNLELQVAGELKDLGMVDTIFQVNFGRKTKPAGNGLDQVEFVISTNPGEPLKQLIKIASGGELSRIMLAIKTIIAAVDNVTTLIFDEIDTGIGGRAVQAVAEKLAQISENQQVICVTHSPQIAGFANNHFYLNKEIKEGRVATKVQVLSETERINEIARMLAGDRATTTTFQQAKEIIQKKP